MPPRPPTQTSSLRDCRARLSPADSGLRPLSAAPARSSTSARSLTVGKARCKLNQKQSQVRRHTRGSKEKQQASSNKSLIFSCERVTVWHFCCLFKRPGIAQARSSGLAGCISPWPVWSTSPPGTWFSLLTPVPGPRMLIGSRIGSNRQTL